MPCRFSGSPLALGAGLWTLDLDRSARAHNGFPYFDLFFGSAVTFLYKEAPYHSDILRLDVQCKTSAAAATRNETHDPQRVNNETTGVDASFGELLETREVILSRQCSRFELLLYAAAGWSTVW